MYMNEFGGTGRQTVDASPYRGLASAICVDSRCTLSSQKDVDIGQPNMLTATLAVVAAIALAPITLQVRISFCQYACRRSSQWRYRLLHLGIGDVFSGS